MAIFFGRLAATLAILTGACFLIASVIYNGQPTIFAGIFYVLGAGTIVSLLLCIIGAIWEYEWWK
jgi:hypothetical protein